MHGLRKMAEAINYSYDDLVEGVNKIATLIQAKEEKFDYIVGVVRGGAIPAVILSHKLKVPLIAVEWSTRDGGEKEHNCWIPEELLLNKKVLIVDDIIDDGTTIRELLDDWQKSIRDPLPLDNIKIAALYYNTAQPTAANYYHRSIDRDIDKRWINFFWEII